MAGKRKPVPDDQRCSAVTTLGTRCSFAKKEGHNVCGGHLAGVPGVPGTRRNTLKSLRYAGGEIGMDHPAYNPIEGARREYRQTVHNIDAIRAELAELEVGELIFGTSEIRTKTTHIGDTEFDQMVDLGLIEAAAMRSTEVTEVQAARIHLLLDLYRWERRQLLEQIKVMAAIGFKDIELRMQRDQSEMLLHLAKGVAKALGADAESPEVRDILRNQLLALLPGDVGRHVIDA